MYEHTKALLKECNSGCRMAINSMNQIESFIEDSNLLQIVNSYKEQHCQIEKKIEKMLDSAEEKEPGLAASAFSWISTEVKMKMENDSHQVAKIMMDGCNMGIQSISEQLNKYPDAVDSAREIAEEIVVVEEKFMKEMKEYL